MNQLNPCCFEQSLMGFLSLLGILDADLYESKIIELAKTGKIRYNDEHAIDTILQSPDGQFSLTVVYDLESLPVVRHETFFYQHYPGSGMLLNHKKYKNRLELSHGLADEALKKANLGQRKTTLNIYSNAIPKQIKRGLETLRQRHDHPF